MRDMTCRYGAPMQIKKENETMKETKMDLSKLPTPPPVTHWEKRDFCVGGETWCVVRDGIHGAIVARVPVSELEREAMRICVEVQNGRSE